MQFTTDGCNKNLANPLIATKNDTGAMSAFLREYKDSPETLHSYGKTGGSQKQGWFVGWVEKEGNHITFARYIEKDNSESYLGPAAKVEVIEALKKKGLLTENF